MDSADDVDERIVRLKSGINLTELISGDGVTFEIDVDDLKESPEYQPTLTDSELLNYSNLDCLGLKDEDTYNDEPFEHLAKKMVDLLPDGKIKKRILREGIGEKVPENGFITCDYNGYYEYNPEPFDSTYAFHRPYRFQLGSQKVIEGLEIAIRSMRISEKSQFLIHFDYAYGPRGCLDRIPPKATVLFEIEVKNCINSGAADKFDENEEQTFENIYEYAEALRLKGNDLYKRNLLKQAIKEYNVAVSQLQKCPVKDYADQEKQQSLLLKLYTNLVITYTKIQVPRKACSSANEIFYLVKGTSLKIPVKVYFNNARALIMLGNFSEAEVKLKQAHKLEPNSSEIADELIKLDRLKQEALVREKKIAKALISNNVDEAGKTAMSDDFKSEVDKILIDLISDPDWLQYKLQNNMSESEIAYVRTAAVEHKLNFCQDGDHHYVYKSEINH